MAPGCKPGGLTPYVGSNPTPCTGLILGGCSSVGRASAFQAEGREFESRRPLQFIVEGQDSRPRSSGVERLLGKEEVMSSNLIAGSSVQVEHQLGRLMVGELSLQVSD